MRKKEGGMSPPSDPRDNALFATLPQEDAARLQPHSNRSPGRLAMSSTTRIALPRFCISPPRPWCRSSTRSPMASTGEMGVVGREGVVGGCTSWAGPDH